MWQSRIHKVREFESSISYNKSLLKSISGKKNNKDIRTSDNLFIKMSHARYSPLDYGQNQDKDRIHNYGKQALHFALMTPIYLAKYLLIFAKPIMIAIGVFLIIICSGRGRKTRRDKMGRGNRKWDTENLNSI